MKIILLIGTMLTPLLLASQTNTDYNLFVSMGIYGSVTGLNGYNRTPVLLHADKLLRDNLAIGFGYSYDSSKNPWLYPGSSQAERTNVRVRFYHYKTNPLSRKSWYLGGSCGLSFWHHADKDVVHGIQDYTNPSIQMLAGLRIQLGDIFFWNGELGLGAPYVVQSSIGIKF